MSAPMPTAKLHWLDELDVAADASLVGGKALGLARLIALGQPVARGFVITRAALDRGVDPALADAILEAFAALDADRVAVRSSAPKEDGASKSYAGCYSSFLEVGREGLLKAIVDCWRSSKGPAAGAYAARHGAPAPASPAVIVQRQVEARLSGVAFSRDPTGRSPDVIVECVRGPCEALVSGELTPDRYTVRREPWRITAREVRAQDSLRRGDRLVTIPSALRGAQKLPDSQIHELAHAVVTLERRLGAPIDIEWAYDHDDQLTLLQQRPITALAPPNPEPAAAPIEFVWEDVLAIWQMDVGAAARGLGSDCLWANQREFVYFREQGRTTMFAPTSTRARERAKAEALAVDAFLEHELRRARALVAQQDALSRDMDPRRVDYTRLRDDDLRALFVRVRSIAAESLRRYNMTSATVTAALTESIARYLDDERDLFTLIQAPAPDLTELEREAWGALFTRDAPTDAQLLDHAYRFPWLTVNHHTVEAVLELLRRRRPGDTRGATARDQRRAQLRARQRALLDRHPHLRAKVSRVHALSHARMELKRGWAGADLYMIPLLTELCRRHAVAHEDLLDAYLADDLEALIEGGRRLDPAVIDARRRAYLWTCEDGVLTRHEGREALLRGRAVAKDAAPRLDPEAALRGETACSGRARGRAYVLSNNEPALLLRALDELDGATVLVSQMLQPNMTDLLRRCVGVVTDEGGLLSHAAILAREFGVPCVVGTKCATRRLKTGDWVVIHGDGSVQRESSEDATAPR